MRIRTVTLVVLCLCVGLVVTSAEDDGARGTVESALQGFVIDFREDPFAESAETTFGIAVKGVGEWHVEIGGPDHVVLKEGPVPGPAPFFITDVETLGRIERGELSIMTAMGRERMSDDTPMNFGPAHGFQLTPESMAELLPLTFHFWTKGRPETVSFGELDQARVIHGAYATVFYYDKGLRTGYYRLENGQHINADPELQTNPFPSLFILIGGVMESRIGGETMTLEAKQAVLVPAGVAHEFWNTRDTPAEFIIIMFGEGA